MAKSTRKKGAARKKVAKRAATTKKAVVTKKAAATKKPSGVKGKARAPMKKRSATAKATRKPAAAKKPSIRKTTPANARAQNRPSRQSTSVISELCDSILALHERSKTPLARAFLPGLTDAEIDALLKPIGIELPQSARELYKWRNGVDRKKMGGYDFFYRMMMFPLHEQIKYSYATLCEVREDFNKSWFPLFDTETADCWAIDCGSATAEDAPIIDFDNYDIDHVAGFASLEQCFRCMLKAFDEGVLGFGERTMDIDFKRFGKLMAKLNPEVADFWNKSG
jgi:hypothetical protein